MSKPSFCGFANTSPAKPRDPLRDGQRHWHVGWQKKHRAGSQHPGSWLLLCCFRAFWWGPSPSARWGGTVGRRKTDRSYVRSGTAEGERKGDVRGKGTQSPGRRGGPPSSAWATTYLLWPEVVTWVMGTEDSHLVHVLLRGRGGLRSADQDEP